MTQPKIATEQLELDGGDLGLFGLVLDSTAPTLIDPGQGIMVDLDAPSYPWHDLHGHVVPRSATPNNATLEVFRGGFVREWAFAAADVSDNRFHIPHDYAPGTDLFIHVHWGHNGTAISGNAVFTFRSTYAKGHNQASFPAEKTLTLTYNTVDIATTPQYRHRIDEIQLSTPGGSATLLDTDLMEADGLILLNTEFTTIPVITGGAPNSPFIFVIDLHYQSTGIGTKNKINPFYT
jgi:hypothetical protein